MQTNIQEKHIPPFYHNWALLMRLHQPIGTFLLLWPTLAALWLASDGHPSPPIVLIFILGTVVMRSAGCVANDLADQRFDAYVQRTQHRPLVTGKVSRQEAKWLLGGLLMIAFMLVCFTNFFTVILSFVGVGLALLYPFMKRYTHFPQVILGAAYAWSIPMAYAAQTQTLPLSCWILYFSTLLFTIAYDTLYAMVDREDDKKIGIKSTAILFGRYDKIIILLLQLSALGLWLLLSGFWVLTAGILIGYQQWLIRQREREACFKAFLNNQWVSLIFFLSILVK